jgi:hypothetical protein
VVRQTWHWALDELARSKERTTMGPTSPEERRDALVVIGVIRDPLHRCRR